MAGSPCIRVIYGRIRVIRGLYDPFLLQKASSVNSVWDPPTLLSSLQRQNRQVLNG